MTGTMEPRLLEEATYVCHYEQSNPAAEISVTVRGHDNDDDDADDDNDIIADQDGEDVSVDLQREPPMKSGDGWAARVEFSLLLENVTQLGKPHRKNKKNKKKFILKFFFCISGQIKNWKNFIIFFIMYGKLH